MPRRKFAWTGVDVPVIGQGTWNIEGTREKNRRAIDALRTGFELGMTHVDTAEMYGSGRSEQVVAEAIAGRREDVFLVTKVLPSNASYKGTIDACERSLERLQTGWIDLYLLHWPGSHPIRETMRAMEELVARGKIRFIGVSNFDVPELKQAQAALTRERLASNQVLYYLQERGIERKLIPYCKSQQIAVVAYSPFGQERFPSAKSAGGRVLAEIGKRHQRTPRQVALNFLTRDPDVFAIPKSGDADHVRENSGSAGWQLDARDIAEIDRAFPAPDRDVPLGML